MIRTQEEFTNACNFIDADMELYDFQLSEKMSSYEYNLYLQDTEYFLNFLYEKIRTLEELCDYLDDYINVKSKTISNTLQEKTKLLNTALHSSQKKQASYDFPLWNIAETVMDRDGATLPMAVISGSAIEGASRKENRVIPIAIQRIGNKVPYADSCDNFINTNSYLVKFKEDVPSKIQEEIQIILPDETSFNCIEYDPLNANISIADVNAKNIVLSIIPKSYQKDKQGIQYNAYADYKLDSIQDAFFLFKADKTAADNINTWNGMLTEKDKEQFLQKIQQAQDLSLQKNNRSETLYNQ